MNTYTDCVGKPIDMEAAKCPICGVVNMPWCDIEHLIPDADSCSGDLYDLDGTEVACGTACWDAPFGDTCGACGNSVLNLETALIGPNGYCHD